MLALAVVAAVEVGKTHHTHDGVLGSMFSEVVVNLMSIFCMGDLEALAFPAPGVARKCRIWAKY